VSKFRKEDILYLGLVHVYHNVDQSSEKRTKVHFALFDVFEIPQFSQVGLGIPKCTNVDQSTNFRFPRVRCAQVQESRIHYTSVRHSCTSCRSGLTEGAKVSPPPKLPSFDSDHAECEGVSIRLSYSALV